MSDGIINGLEFERQIADLSDRELLEFTARKVFSMTEMCENHGKRLAALEKQRGGKVIAGIGAFVGGSVAGAVYGVLTLFKH